MSMVPYHSSDIKNYKTYENSFLPKIVTIPLAQESGYEYKILVNRGDVVAEGDVIASYTDESLYTVNIHSSIPGVVEDFVPTVCPNGKFNYSIKIKLQGSFKYLGKKKEPEKPESVFSSSVINDLIDKGVINTFLLSKPVNLGLEIKSLNKRKLQSLVVRLCDEDNFRITDSLISSFFITEVIQATKIISKAINAKGIVFVVNKTFSKMEELQNCGIDNSRILIINNSKFPCGFKREIINEFNKSLKKSLPFRVSKNDLFVDSSTMYDVYKSILLKLPSIDKMVHFTGNCIYSSCLLNVKLGTSIKDIVNQIGGFEKSPSLVVINGNQTGASVSSLDVPITKYTKSVSFLSSKKVTDNHIYSCINCGKCREVCPIKICPDVLYKYAKHDIEIDEIYLKTATVCNSCSLCNTVCPARLPLGQMIATIKEKMTNK